MMANINDVMRTAKKYKEAYNEAIPKLQKKRDGLIGDHLTFKKL